MTLPSPTPTDNPIWRSEQEHQMLRQAMAVGRCYAFEWLPRTDQVRRSVESIPILGLEGDRAALQESGASFIQRLHPDDRTALVRAILGLTPSHRTYRARYRLFRPDGQMLTLEETGQGEFDADGTLVQVFGIAADVSHKVLASQIKRAILVNQSILGRKRAEAELRRRNQELATLNAVGSALSASLVLSDVLETCRGLLAARLEGSGGAVYLYDRAVGGLELRAAWGQAETEKERGRGPAGHPALAAYLRAVVETQDVVVGADRICVPLLAQGSLHGVLDLMHPFEDGIAPVDLSFYQALGRELGAAIRNAILFEEVVGSHHRLQSLSRRLVEIQEAERSSLARELHDEAGQAVMGLKLGLRALERSAGDPAVFAVQVAELKRMADGVLDTLHNLAMDLRPASLDHLGLREWLQQYAETMAEKHGLKVDFETVGLAERLPLNMENALYRVVQEALVNVVRHARATRVDILLEQRQDKVLLLIEDDGIGLDPTKVMTGANGRLGLVGIRERAEMLGGSLVIESQPGSGTSLLVEAPYVPADPDRG